MIGAPLPCCRSQLAAVMIMAAAPNWRPAPPCVPPGRPTQMHSMCSSYGWSQQPSFCFLLPLYVCLCLLCAAAATHPPTLHKFISPSHLSAVVTTASGRVPLQQHRATHLLLLTSNLSSPPRSTAFTLLCLCLYRAGIPAHKSARKVNAALPAPRIGFTFPLSLHMSRLRPHPSPALPVPTLCQAPHPLSMPAAT